MKATDLPLLTSVSRPTIAPDGARAIVAVSHPDLDSDAYVGQLWSVPLTGAGTARRITRGINDSAPRFSPDGNLLAFVRVAGEGPGQLFVMDAAGGEPLQVTDAKLGVGSWRWSPDGTRIAFSSRVPEAGRYGTVAGLEPSAEPARQITTFRYRSNGLGYTNDRRSHLFLVDVPDVTAEPRYTAAPSTDSQASPDSPDSPDSPAEHPGTVPEATQLTSGDFDHGAFAFSPDGTTLAFVSARHEDRDIDLASNIFLIALDSPEREPVAVTGVHRNYDVNDVAYTGDGSLFFIATDLGHSARDFVGRSASLYLIDPSGGAAIRLTDPETTDLGEGQLTAFGRDAVLVQSRERGRLELLRVSADGTVVSLTPSEVEITGHDAVDGVIVVAYSDTHTVADLAVIRGDALAPLTDFSAPLREAGITMPADVVISARDGYPVHGWVLAPRGDGPHPVLLMIHGGPFTQYSASIFDEAQVYVDAGYAVAMCNPRGAAGYGETHGRAIRHAMGTVDYTDVLDFLGGAIERDARLDGTRLGILGGSYGGYLTAWTIAHDHRFAGAIVERGFLDPEQFVGTSDIGSFFSDEYVGTDADQIRAQSPQAVVDNVATPTLVLHSENDLRCPLGQAERYYTALKRGGAQTELVIFPGENHELSRGGQPRHRLQRFEIILRWWARYLPSELNHARGDAS